MSADAAPAVPGSSEDDIPSPPRPAITPKDIYEVPRLAVQGLLAWALPEIRLVAAVPPVRSNECRDASLTDAPRDRGHRLCPRRYAGREQNRAHRSRKLGQSLRGAIPLPPRVASRRLEPLVGGRGG